jgi:flagellar protein FlgJ
MTEPIRQVTPDFTVPHAPPRAQQPAPVETQATQLLKLRKAAGEFEALFLSQLLATMQSTVHRTEQGKSMGGEIMLDVASERLADDLAKQGGIGLGDMLYRSMQRHIPSSLDSVKAADRPIPRASDRSFRPLVPTAPVNKGS